MDEIVHSAKTNLIIKEDINNENNNNNNPIINNNITTTNNNNNSQHQSMKKKKKKLTNATINNANRSSSNSSINLIYHHYHNNSNNLQQKKWKCVQCTYENWPSALKCTICLNSKTLVPNNNATNNASAVIVSPLAIASTSSYNKNSTSVSSASSKKEKQKKTMALDSQQKLNQKKKKKKSTTSSKLAIATDHLINNDIYEIGNLLNTSTSTNENNSSNNNVVQNGQQNTGVSSSDESSSSTLSSSNKSSSSSEDEEEVNEEKKETKPSSSEQTASSVSFDQPLLDHQELSQFLQKWSCTQCTYLNWPKSIKCVQCLYPREETPKSEQTTTDSAASASTPGDLTLLSNKSTISASAVVASSSVSVSPKVRSLCNSPCTVPKTNSNSQFSSSETIVSAGATASIDQTQSCLLKKWFCSQCTYQNWPKSQRCVMCHVQRSNIPVPPQSKPKEVIVLTEEPSSSSQPPQITTAANPLLLNFYKRKEFLINLIHNNNEPNATSSNAADQSLIQLMKHLQQFQFQQQIQRQIRPQQNIFNTSSSSSSSSSSSVAKCAPCQYSPSLASNIIDRYFSSCLRQRGLNWPQGGGAMAEEVISESDSGSYPFCFYATDCATFTLPSEISQLSSKVQHFLFEQLLDKEVQQELEQLRIINWWLPVPKKINNISKRKKENFVLPRLFSLWNRHSGDCLLDSVLQACVGVCDTPNALRAAMADSLRHFGSVLRGRWLEHEIRMAQALGYTPDERQLDRDWLQMLQLAQQPGCALEQAHIFTLAHVLRRPIVIYSVKYVQSSKSGENIGYTHFEGVYLPLQWEAQFCFPSPICLGYTKGHFTALVTIEEVRKDNESEPEAVVEGAAAALATKEEKSRSPSPQTEGAIARSSDNMNRTNQDQDQLFYLPLTNCDGQLLPVHFLTKAELGRERSILRQYMHLDSVNMGGQQLLMVAQQRVTKSGILVQQMMDEWMQHYRMMQVREIQHQLQNSHNDVITEDLNFSDEEDEEEEEKLKLGLMKNKENKSSPSSNSSYSSNSSPQQQEQKKKKAGDVISLNIEEKEEEKKGEGDDSSVQAQDDDDDDDEDSDEDSDDQDDQDDDDDERDDANEYYEEVNVQ